MNIVFIIYIFALFVITSPNVVFKISNIKLLNLTVLHGLLFISIIYFTLHFILRYREGVNYNTSLDLDTVLETDSPEASNEITIHNTSLDLDTELETDSPEASSEITIHNKILDYTNYTNNSENNDPLPGPIPK